MAVVFFRPYEITFTVCPMADGDENDLRSFVRGVSSDSAIANSIRVNPDRTPTVVHEPGMSRGYRLSACVQRHESPDDVYSALMAEFRAAGWDDGTARHRRWLKERGLDLAEFQAAP